MSERKASPTNCSNCGAPVSRRFGESAVCEYCGSVILPPESEKRILTEQARKPQPQWKPAPIPPSPPPVQYSRKAQAPRMRLRDKVFVWSTLIFILLLFILFALLITGAAIDMNPRLGNLLVEAIMISLLVSGFSYSLK